MTTETTMKAQGDVVANGIAEEFIALAELLEAAGPPVWDEPSLCEGWRTREVVAHVTMPVRYEGPAFMAELEAAGGDFTHSPGSDSLDGLRASSRVLARLHAVHPTRADARVDEAVEALQRLLPPAPRGAAGRRSGA